MAEIPFQINKAKALPEGRSVCYVLGAGFSQACHPEYPLSVGFLATRGGDPHLACYGDGSRSEYTSGLLNRLEEQFGPLTDVNLEDVITDLYIRAFGLGSAWEHLTPRTGFDSCVYSAQRDYYALLQYIVELLFTIDRAASVSQNAKSFVKALGDADSVITLNYDTVLERHLRDDDGEEAPRVLRLHQLLGPALRRESHGIPAITTVFERGAPGVFVKLHGCIDWYSCANPDCPYHSYVSVGWLSNDASALTPGARCRMCGSGLEVVIVPPSLNKPFDRFPKLRTMWLRAYESLHRSQRWTLIGTSMAATDFHLSALFRSASRGLRQFDGTVGELQLCVVDKDIDSAKDIAQRLYGSLHTQTQKGLRSGQISISVFGSLSEYLSER